jgi:hypothetical protein
MDLKSFEAKMYSIEDIHHFALGPERFASLTEAQKRSLVESRNDFIALEEAIEYGGDVTKYVSPEMVRKYGTSTALVASMIAPETSILAAGVSECAFVDKGTIRLETFAVVFSEGYILVNEIAVVLKETDSGWRVAEFKVKPSGS